MAIPARPIDPARDRDRRLAESRAAYGENTFQFRDRRLGESRSAWVRTFAADDMKVLTEGDKLLAIGKTITEYDAESIGFLRFSPDGAALFVRYIEAIMRRPEGLKRWYLSVINEIAHETGVVRVQSIQGLGWAEMDFPEDVAANRALAAKWAAAL